MKGRLILFHNLTPGLYSQTLHITHRLFPKKTPSALPLAHGLRDIVPLSAKVVSSDQDFNQTQNKLRNTTGAREHSQEDGSVGWRLSTVMRRWTVGEGNIP